MMMIPTTDQAKEKHYVSLEKELGYEEDLSHNLKQNFNQLEERNLKKDWNNQIEAKKLRNEETKAEALIYSLESKIRGWKILSRA
ncbi:hypothetical protein Avbf_02965 [Armadillidium vulgare]|nr:hypothetical protein Avbf_02965 [Armadillidium vulgare]